MSKDLNQLTIKEARGLLDSGTISSVELTRACLDRIKAVDGQVKACLTVCEKEAVVEAEAADARLQNGEKGGLLGIPYAAKDNIMTKGVRTTAASKILENYIAPFDATIIERIRKAGAVLLAKTNLDEFAHGASTENSAFGPTRNPWDLERVPGGSSGGSAAAVAAHECIFALGTDTGGSIRHPASLCGVYGLKPTYGLSSRFGLIAMTSSTDVPGPLTKCAEDQAAVLAVMAGQDRRDATTIASDFKYQDGPRDFKGLKIGLPVEIFKDKMEPETAKVMETVQQKFRELGAELTEVSLPHTKYGIAVYYIITPSEISSNLARFDGVRYGLSAAAAKSLKEVYTKSKGEGFGPEVKRRIMLGTYALSSGYYDAYYKKAQQVRTIIRAELDSELTNVDMILTPTSYSAAFKIGQKSNDPLSMYLEDLYVTNPSLAGLPALSVPAGFINGLPIGFQLIGNKLQEAKLLQSARVWEANSDVLTKQLNL